MYAIKKDGSKEPFDITKIQTAIMKAAGRTTTNLEEWDVVRLSERVVSNFSVLDTVSVDSIHKATENALMEAKLYDVAREYISYRATHRNNIFDKRVAFKPFEYPSLYRYVDAIRNSYWVHTEFSYTSDKQDYDVKFDEHKRTVAKRAMLAISQIEVAVKTFWGNVGNLLPKPEVAAVGATFAESEVRHSDAYSHFLELFGFNKEFEDIQHVPAIRKRIDYLENSLSGGTTKEEITTRILLFSVLIENISLFSQFITLMSFYKFDNTMKGVSNAVQATSKEEDIHAKFGIDLVKTIVEENRDFMTPELQQYLNQVAVEAFNAEMEILEWIFDGEDLPWISRADISHYMMHRLNTSFKQLGLEPVFADIDTKNLEATLWFDEELLGEMDNDNFNQRNTAYNKKNKAFSIDALL
jgi:ribonucleoside-diphosphate reductase beta chain